jgi:photosystem II stability/assembly factor-like uncharacterized protein
MKKFLLAAVTFCLVSAAKGQWLAQNAGFTNAFLGFYDISIPNANTAWAICYDGRFGLNNGPIIIDFTRTVNGGNTWIPGKIGNDATLQPSNISAISEDEAWVAMNKRYVTGGGLYHTTDGGVTWEQTNAGEIFDQNSFPNFVYFKDRNHGIAMGDPNNGYFEVYTTNNKGKKWKRVPQADLPPSLPNEYGWLAGYAAVGNTIWFGTLSGRMYKSENFGKDWTVSTVDPGGKGVYEIAFNDDGLRGVTHVRDNVGNVFLYNTIDGGKTWTSLGQPANWKRSRITAVPGTDALVSTSVIVGPSQGSAISYDNGVTWTELEHANRKAAVKFLNATTGWAGGYHLSVTAALPLSNGGLYKSQIIFQLPEGHHDNVNTGNKQKTIQPEKLVMNDGVKVYPTPAHDVVNIVLPDALAKTANVISLLTADGKTVQIKRTQASNLIQLPVSKLPPGIYILRIASHLQTINKVITISR